METFNEISKKFNIGENEEEIKDSKEVKSNKTEKITLGPGRNDISTKKKKCCKWLNN